MQLDDALIHRLVGRIYDAATSDVHPEAGWQEVLTELSHATGSVTGALQIVSDSGRATRLLGTHNVDAESGRLYQDYYVTKDLFVQRAGPSLFGAPAVSHLYVDDQEMERSEFYTDFMRRRLGGGFYNVGLAHQLDGGAALFLGLQRDRRRGMFHADEVGPLSLLWGHLLRAVQLQLRLRSTEARATMGHEALDHLTDAVLVLERDARLAFANRAGERLLAQADGIAVGRDGRVAVSRPAEQARFAAAVSRCARPVLGESCAEEMLRISRRGAAPALLALLAPFAPGRRLRREAEGDRVLVVLSDPATRADGVGARAARLFGLTAAEARVVEALAAGLTPDEYAETRGIRISTVRSQVQAALAKTGTLRQTEMLRLLLAIPRVGEE